VSRTARRIDVRGVVQGVGFRPFVYGLARRWGLTGWVCNTSSQVEIWAEGPAGFVEDFYGALESEAPPLARIESITWREVLPCDHSQFQIRESVKEESSYQLISPDIATCQACLRELSDPRDRRYRYPFTNCTNCGPRFTIIEDIPYDRARTTMRDFQMCPQCQAEYDDPSDRRFHAQPNACPTCGPRLQLADGQGDEIYCDDVISEAVGMLLDGKSLAIKGLGGFHLACDGTNARAVRVLRDRKRRPSKPLAVMMPDMEMVLAHCQVTPEADSLLRSPQSPIVLLPWQASSTVAREVAPGLGHLGVMLPCTPLHHILLREMGRPLVMTSGNLSEEPIAKDNPEALERLGSLADAFILHDRAIYARYDDSVLFVPRVDDEPFPQPIRRSRGYAPFPVRLSFPVSPILAVGAELKSTFCLARDRYAFVSPHIGDLENVETLEHFESSVELYKRLFRLEPQVVTHDLHPDYLSTRYAMEVHGVRLVPVQHHHAHIMSVLLDNGWHPQEGAVLGVAMDGTGYGQDGHIWGGEFMKVDSRGFQRLGHLEYLPMPGGDTAIRKPYRLAIGYTYALLGRDPIDSLQPGDFTPEELELILAQVDRGLNAPLTSSCGRLFDAVSALLGVRREISYEAQAAVELEAISTAGRPATESYPFPLEECGQGWVIRLRDMWEGLLADQVREHPVADLGMRFHQTVIQMLVAGCLRAAGETGLRRVALSGGCFQNRLLLEGAIGELRQAGFEVMLHRQVPTNDGGIALGQVGVAHIVSQAENEPYQRESHVLSGTRSN
jgi:hydrogenase maturation protein HypF